MDSRFTLEKKTREIAEETRKGPWTREEDLQLIHCISFYGEGRWATLAKASGLRRTGKSCRLRWVNYLRPDLKRSRITPDEERLIVDLHGQWGNRWSRIAQHLPGRTDNEIKNYFRSHIRKKLQRGASRNNDSDNLRESLGLRSDHTNGVTSPESGNVSIDLSSNGSVSETSPGKVTKETQFETNTARYRAFVGSVAGIDMPNSYAEGFFCEEAIYISTVDCSAQNTSESEPFVDYSDELWNINQGHGYIPKYEDTSW